MSRKTRVRTISVPREDGFICSTCGAKGDCSDSIKDKTPFYWDKDEKKIICKKCDRRLCKKSELEEELEIPEIQQYGFWLRFASEHLIPCEKCQDRLHEKLMKTSLFLGGQQSIVLYKEKHRHINMRWRFHLEFLKATYVDFVPCDKCQKRLQEIWDTKELHIGNDMKPMVELWRKWEINEAEDK